MKSHQIGRLRQMIDDMSHNRLQNYIVPGISSELVGDGGTKRGKVRVFRAEREARDFVTPHSHRFNFCAIVLAGRVHNTLFAAPMHSQEGDLWCSSTITQVCGAKGLYDYKHQRATEPNRWVQITQTYEERESYYMDSHEIHSIVFEKGTEVLIFEGPQLTDVSEMLEPWVDGKCIPTFKTEPWMFQKVPQ